MSDLTDQTIATIKSAANQLSGADRRAFQAQVARDHLQGNARQAERIFGWSRETIEKGQRELIRLVYYPPYQSKYNPIERCWGILEMHWNGTLFSTIEKALKWAATMTGKGLHPMVSSLDEVYEKGVKLTKKAMKPYAQRLDRSDELPKWNVVIQHQA